MDFASSLVEDWRATMNVLAIDPGLKGGIAFVSSPEVDGVRNVRAWKMPLMKIVGGAHMMPDPEAIQSIISLHDPHHVVMERVHAMPKQGVNSMFTFGGGFMSVITAIVAMGCPEPEYVLPQVWKKALGLGRDKGDSLELARHIFPEVSLGKSSDEGKAEALLIAHWYRKKHEGIK